MAKVLDTKRRLRGMSFSEVSTIEQLKNTRNRLNVSQSKKKHSGSVNFAGRPIAELEVAPHDDSVISLGTYKEALQPKGFCIEYNSSANDAELVKSEVTIRKVSSGYQYLLQITNNTNRMLSAEVRLL